MLLAETSRLDNENKAKLGATITPLLVAAAERESDEAVKPLAMQTLGTWLSWTPSESINGADILLKGLSQVKGRGCYLICLVEICSLAVNEGRIDSCACYLPLTTTLGTLVKEAIAKAGTGSYEPVECLNDLRA